MVVVVFLSMLVKKSQLLPILETPNGKKRQLIIAFLGITRNHEEFSQHDCSPLESRVIVIVTIFVQICRNNVATFKIPRVMVRNCKNIITLLQKHNGNCISINFFEFIYYLIQIANFQSLNEFKNLKNFIFLPKVMLLKMGFFKP